MRVWSSGGKHTNVLRMRNTFSFSLILVAQLGCTGDNATTSSHPPPVMSVTAPPEFEVSVGGYPTGAARLPDGRVVISDGWGARLEFYDSSAKPLKSAGRKGSGAGEHATPFLMGLCDRENIFVRDGAAMRVSIIDTSGTFLRSFPADPSASACNQDNEFVFVKADAPTSTPQPWERPQIQGTVFFAKGDGKPKAIIPRIFAYEPRTMGPVTRFAIGTDRFFVTYGHPDSQFVDVFNFKGRKLARFPTHLPTRIVTDEMFNGYIEQSARSFEQPDARVRSYAFLKQFEKPLHTPVASQLLTDPKDNLWLVRTFPGDRTTLIRVFDKRGVMLVDVEMPLQMHIFEVGTDYMLGMHHRDGQRYVAMYAFDLPK